MFDRVRRLCRITCHFNFLWIPIYHTFWSCKLKGWWIISDFRYQSSPRLSWSNLTWRNTAKLDSLFKKFFWWLIKVEIFRRLKRTSWIVYFTSIEIIAFHSKSELHAWTVGITKIIAGRNCIRWVPWNYFVIPPITTLASF